MPNNLPIPFFWVTILILALLYIREVILNRPASKLKAHTLEEAQQKALEIIHSAIKKSQDITSQGKLMDERWKENFQKTLDQNQTQIMSETQELFEKFEENLSNYLTQTQTQSTRAIELELKAARSLIDNYKSSQLRVVDENIIAILEKTLSIILSKKLTLADQMDLVYKALEKAKAEKFFV